MYCCCCDYNDELYFREKMHFPTHCSTCSCGKSELEVTSEIRIPKKHTISCRKFSCSCLPELICCCPYGNLLENDTCLCYECRKIRGRSEAIIHRRDRSNFSDNKYTLLETWFTRFDSNGDGYLDLPDIESLLKHLGAKVRNSSTKKILQICDRDCDGRLSFSEFIRLWKQAADHEEDFIKKIECPDLSHIAKKYSLFSDMHHCSCHEHRCDHITIATQHPVQQTKCKCGCKDKVIPYVKHEDLAHSSRRKVYKSKDRDDSKEFPTMSKNRDDII